MHEHQSTRAEEMESPLRGPAEPRFPRRSAIPKRHSLTSLAPVPRRRFVDAPLTTTLDSLSSTAAFLRRRFAGGDCCEMPSRVQSPRRTTPSRTSFAHRNARRIVDRTRLVNVTACLARQTRRTASCRRRGARGLCADRVRRLTRAARAPTALPHLALQRLVGRTCSSTGGMFAVVVARRTALHAPR